MVELFSETKYRFGILVLLSYNRETNTMLDSPACGSIFTFKVKFVFILIGA